MILIAQRLKKEEGRKKQCFCSHKLEKEQVLTTYEMRPDKTYDGGRTRNSLVALPF